MIQKHQLKNLEIFKFSFQKIDYQILLNTFTNTPICNLKLLDLNTTSLGSLNMALLC